MINSEVNITDFPELEEVPEPRQELPSIKVNGIAKISSQSRDFGVQVSINNKIFRLRYPTGLWSRFPKTHRNILAQNLTYSLTYHIPYLYPTLKKVFYNMPVPLSEAFLFKSLSLSLPSVALMQTQKDKKLTSNLLRRLFEIDYIFTNKKTEIPPYNRTSLSDHVIMPFTFGKDSLLTYSLASELGLKVYPVYISEPDYPYQELIKKVLSNPFRKEFKEKIYFLQNNMGILREPYGWFGWELQLTQYSLMLLPYVYAKKAGYILFSNEQSCDDYITDVDGFRCNPIFEQSHSWLLQNSLMTSIIGGNSLSIGSLIEPLHEIAIMKILHHRYPEIGKYQSSCDMDYKPKSNGRWCETCSKCGRMYIFLQGLGISSKKLGFKHNLLSKKYRNLYGILDNRSLKNFGYDQSEAGRDEQIFAFHLAYKRGVKGPLITEFVKKYIKYATKNEKSFRRRFFGIHSNKTVPSPFKAKLLRIYHQELDHLT
ncbi:MAG: hypothetical protein UT63_C0002G0020 [Candidatus Gottesmanbacteria bacterium GW2011_GWC2_39_8]|uniref:Uncharacterized protein n=1 Tax=Candidatus Gottesmanbacteria bacterium GW2011_GWC2_39_8 TaxID=1618450 RepID=A0A0G0SI73_9BACT|nr:MAG: hypothetical protein UT63_C0002G0020 [Candidatus Gottesmanbacteria bacterium GW2011_GWC2_39_8]